MIYTDFQDTIVGSGLTGFPNLEGQVNQAQYRKKVEAFLRSQETHPVVRKIRQAAPLSAADLEALEVLLFDAGEVQSREVFEEVYGKQENLATFIRSLVGLDRQAAEQVFARYLNHQVFNSAQLRFVENLVEMLTRTGSVQVSALYEPPFTNASPQGIDGVFKPGDADQLVDLIRSIGRATVPLQS